MCLFEVLGFSWDLGAVPRLQFSAAAAAQAVARHRADLARFVFDAAALEGNPLSLEEVAALIAGEPPEGREAFHLRQALNLAEAAEEASRLVETGRFHLGKPTFDRLHGLIAREEALEWGGFRGEGRETRHTPEVLLGVRGSHRPPPTEPGARALNRLYAAGVEALEREAVHPWERAMGFFLFGALQQFYFDGNKRSARFMMNGLLKANGLDAVSIPASEAEGFNARMVEFYLSRDGTEMMGFLLDCARLS